MTRSPANPVGAQLCASGRPKSEVRNERWRARNALQCLNGCASDPARTAKAALEAMGAAADAELAGGSPLIEKRTGQ